MLRSSLRGGGSTATVVEKNHRAIGCDPCSGSLRNVIRAPDLRRVPRGIFVQHTSRAKHRVQRSGGRNSGVTTDGIHGRARTLGRFGEGWLRSSLRSSLRSRVGRARPQGRNRALRSSERGSRASDREDKSLY